MIYNSSYNLMQFCNGTSWVNMGSSGTISGIGTLTNGDFCNTDGSVINCTTASISLTTSVSGTLQAAQFPALTGDITTTAGSLTTAIGAGKVTNNMLAGSIAYGKLSLTTSIVNGDLAGSIAASKLVGTDIATVGTITAGTWNGTAIGVTYGGTGVTSLTGFTSNIATTAGIGIGTNAVASTAVLDMVSTTKGFLPPRMTTTQRDAITTPATGLTIYNTTTNAMNLYNGSAWGSVGSGAGGSSGQLQYNTGSALGGAAALTYATSGSLLTTTAQAATDKPLIVKAAASQSANLMEFQDSSGTATTTVDATGGIVVAGVTGGAGVNGSAGSASGSSGQVQYNSSGAFTGAAGLVYATSGTIVQATAQAATDKALVVKGAASQSANILEVQDSSAAVLLSVASTGAVTSSSSATASAFIPSGSTLPTNGIYLPASNKLGFATNTTAAMVIDSSQRVGIGTTSPLYPFHVHTGTDRNFRVSTAVIPSDGIAIDSANDANSANKSLELRGNPIVMSVGNVGIGTATPHGLLQVRTGIDEDLVIHTPNSQSNGVSLEVANDAWTADTPLEIRASPTIFTTGNVGIGTTSPSYTLHVNGSVAGTSAYNNLSDERYKKDIANAPYGLETIGKLRPVTFNWRKPTNDTMQGRQLGLIAQEVQPVVPEAVSTANDKMKTMSIAYGTLVPVLIKAVQEEQTEIEALKIEIKALKDQIKR